MGHVTDLVRRVLPLSLDPPRYGLPPGVGAFEGRSHHPLSEGGVLPSRFEGVADLLPRARAGAACVYVCVCVRVFRRGSRGGEVSMRSEE